MRKKIINFRPLKKIDVDRFKSDIDALDLHQKDYNTVDDLVDTYNKALSGLLDHHAPLNPKP